MVSTIFWASRGKGAETVACWREGLRLNRDKVSTRSPQSRRVRTSRLWLVANPSRNLELDPAGRFLRNSPSRWTSQNLSGKKRVEDNTARRDNRCQALQTADPSLENSAREFDLFFYESINKNYLFFKADNIVAFVMAGTIQKLRSTSKKPGVNLPEKGLRSLFEKCFR
jgi:hypothetical protein